MGGLSTYPVTVPAQGPSGFQPGAAVAQARAVIRDGGHVADVQEWTRAVELAVLP